MIPELPRGREMTISITTTWGDRHYVGLTGIEFFTSDGPPPTVKKVDYQLFERIQPHNLEEKECWGYTL